MHRIELDQLPQYSHWPARLLGIEDFANRVKTKAEIDREYEREKWGMLLRAMASDPRAWTLADADEFFLRELQAAMSRGAELFVAPALAAHAAFVDEIAARVAGLRPAAALVELGAGYGSVILNLARRPQFRGRQLLAGEYAPSGVKALQTLAVTESTTIAVGACDFTLPALCDFDIPAGACIYTCMATPCVPLLEDVFVDGLVARRPALVAHIEPCVEHYDDTLLGMLRKKYLIVNDYNRNLLSLLRRRQQDGTIRILKEEPVFFGENCLLPSSFIVWEPAR